MGINLANKGYNNVSAAIPGDFSPIPAGGYVCRIIDADITNSKNGNLMLVLFVDISEGDFSGYFRRATENARQFDKNKKWINSGTYRQLILDKNGLVAPFFKGLLTCIEKSNKNFTLDLNNFEAISLRGTFCGFVIAHEEYEKRDLSIGTRPVLFFPKSVDDIRNCNFSIPDTKKLDNTVKPSYDSSGFSASPIDPNDVPF